MVEYRGQGFTHTKGFIHPQNSVGPLQEQEGKGYGRCVSRILQELISSLLLFFDCVSYLCILMLAVIAGSPFFIPFFSSCDELGSFRLTATGASLSKCVIVIKVNRALLSCLSSVWAWHHLLCHSIATLFHDHTWQAPLVSLFLVVPLTGYEAILNKEIIGIPHTNVWSASLASVSVLLKLVAELYHHYQLQAWLDF